MHDEMSQSQSQSHLNLGDSPTAAEAARGAANTAAAAIFAKFLREEVLAERTVFWDCFTVAWGGEIC